MESSPIKIIQAKESDLDVVFDFVKQLALYEKEPESVTTDIDEYRTSFNQGIFEAILAKKGDNTLGIALYYMTFSTWKGRMLYLEDFVVDQKYREQGVGKMLFDRFIQIAKEKNAKLAKWQVLDWNTPAIKFYEKENATIEKNWWNGKIVF